MDIKIYANETAAVLEALNAGKEKIDAIVYSIKNDGKSVYLQDDIVKEKLRQKESLNRVIDRIQSM